MYKDTLLPTIIIRTRPKDSLPQSLLGLHCLITPFSSDLNGLGRSLDRHHAHRFTNFKARWCGLNYLKRSTRILYSLRDYMVERLQTLVDDAEIPDVAKAKPQLGFALARRPHLEA